MNSINEDMVECCEKNINIIYNDDVKGFDDGDIQYTLKFIDSTYQYVKGFNDVLDSSKLIIAVIDDEPDAKNIDLFITYINFCYIINNDLDAELTDYDEVLKAYVYLDIDEIYIHKYVNKHFNNLDNTTVLFKSITNSMWKKGDCIIHAIENDNIAKVWCYFKKSQNLFIYSASRKYNWSILNIAIKCGNLRIVKILIELGADINDYDHLGYTALNTACSVGNIEIVQLLLDYGADIHTLTTYSGCNAIDLACASGHIEIVQLLMNNGSKINLHRTYNMSAIHRAAENGHIDIVQLILNSGDYVNDVCNYRNTSLYYAYMSSHYDIVKLLLENGADPNLVCSRSTIIDYACKHGKIEMVRLLLKYGADPNIQDYDGFTALYYASINGYSTIVRLLLKNGADPNIRSHYGFTPLYYSYQDGYDVITIILKDFGAI